MPTLNEAFHQHGKSFMTFQKEKKKGKEGRKEKQRKEGRKEKTEREGSYRKVRMEREGGRRKRGKYK